MTIAQQILGIEELYIGYDFDGRFERRKGIMMDINVCEKNLLDTKNVLDNSGMVFWLMYGTLLGAVRDKTFMEFDTDTDLGLFIESKDEFVKIILALKELGFELIRTNYNDKLISLMRNDEYIDFYFYKKDNLPFTYFIEYPFLNTMFKIPSNTVVLLNDWYGNNWIISELDKHATKYYGFDL